MNFSQKLQNLMILTGISQSKLSKELSVDASLTSRWRKGERSPLNNQELVMSIAHAFAVRIRMNYQFEALSSMLGHEIAMDITIDALKVEILFWLNTENLIFIKFISRVHHSEEMKRSLVQSVMADVDLGMDNDMIQKNRPYCLGAEQWDTTICAGLFIV